MIVGILLAAGRGTRFGTRKLLHPLADGTLMVLAALRNLSPSVDQVVVVVRHDDSELIQVLSAEKADILPCPKADLGMGASLACGVCAAPDADAWLIALADMPYVPSTVSAALSAQLNAGAQLVAPTYQGQRGHPVGFGRMFYSELTVLSADFGARQILEQHADQLRLIAVDEPGILRDIDTPDDLLA